MKQSILHFLLLLLVLASFGFCATACSSDGPEKVFREMGVLMDELIGILDSSKKDVAAATLAMEGFLSRNGARVKALASA